MQHPDTHEPTPRAAKPGRRLKIAAAVVGTLGLLVAGAGLGQVVWPARVTQQVVVAPEEQAAEAATTARFPHVLGLDVASARAVIASAGFTAAQVTTDTVPAAGPQGYVVRQQPDPHEQLPLDHATAQLTLSEPVTMPDLAGKPADDARRSVTDLFGVAQVDRVTTADQPAGVVLSTEPAAGQPMPVNVVLKVSDGGEAMALTDLDAVTYTACSRAKDQTVNGTLHALALTCTPGRPDRPAHLEYAIGRHATFLDATIGMLDTGGVGSATVRVLGDGTQLATMDVAFGTSQPLRVPVRDVLRLRIEVTGPEASPRPVLVLGDIRLVGDPDKLDQLGE
ncbi:PASTA domain-containing protein [Propioniciclava sp. MC1595]|uniref:PASTA domain-containing protein n=1 Tax=Propioniciclava sp. MC1595 TaxID=2760308 RepID=UPI0016623555|nr:PASTA domain-containing protein [Propioniciclava sp. MC1595]MBB1495149.1 PASTA domain-containing protein [Propioniciclava sp. MC1595]QTE26155.1 PASTA domain-containing protein [Propioniciclava sp. MC1595]